jgi:lysyl-tRNA synthetase class 2
MPRLYPESLLAWAAAGVGAIGVASALTPELASRYDLVRGVLPPGVPTAARVAALAFGLALVWLSRSLARRRRRAWQLAVGLVVVSAAAHLAKGLDVEEAAAALALLAALVRFRGRFDVPGDPRAVRPVAAIALAAAAGGVLALGVDLRGGAVPDRLSDLLAALGPAGGLAGLYLWLRPLSQAVAQTIGERRAARALVELHGADSLAFFALRRDKSYFFAPSGRAFLAYRVVAGTALVSGDPVGEAAEIDELLAEFRRVAHSLGWRLAVVGVSAAMLPRYRALGLRPIAMGDEAVVRPASFSLDGRSIRKVRQSVTRLERSGFAFRVAAADAVDARLRAQLGAVSAAWRGGRAERGFSMAMDDLFAEGTVFAIAETAAGEVGGFLHLVPAGGGWSLSTMRRRASQPNGLTAFLVARALEWMRDRGSAELSLNFCALTDFIATDRATTMPRRVVRRALLAADRVFQLERLHAFNRKFRPEWRPRYLCVERYADVPLVALAYLRAERLLAWPARQRVSH